MFRPNRVVIQVKPEKGVAADQRAAGVEGDAVQGHQEGGVEELVVGVEDVVVALQVRAAQPVQRPLDHLAVLVVQQAPVQRHQPRPVGLSGRGRIVL